MRIGSRRQSPKSLPVIVAVLSAVVHLALAAVIQLGSGSTTVLRVAAVAEDELAAAAGLDPAEVALADCQTNAVLAAWATAAYCLTPMAEDICLQRLDVEYEGWLAACTDIFVKQQKKKQRDKQPVRIALLDDAALAKLEPLPLLPLLQPKPPPKPKPQLQPAQPPPPSPAAPKPAPPPRSAQVVEITPPASTKPPKNARFVSEYDSSVEKEKVARGSTEKMTARPAPKELPVADKQKLPDKSKPPPEPIAKKQPKSDQKHEENDRGTGKLDMRKPGEREELPRKPRVVGTADGRKDPIAVNGFAPRRGERRQRWRKRKMTTRPDGEGGVEGERGRPTLPDLRPSEELLSRLARGGSVDKLDGVESDKHTALNSKRWKYASFFNRLKRQVAQNWHPNQVYMARDPTGNVYGGKNRRTTVRVSLRGDGSLAEIHIVRRSGVSFLDDEAVRAFRAAGPFPNPPGALVDAQSKVITFSFGFHFEIGSRGARWKIFRQR